jgi:mannosyltransferase
MRRVWILALLSGMTALALAESLFFLGRESFWLDEAYSVFLARLPSSSFWDVVTSSEANAALYYVLLRGWIVLGTSEAVVRLLSVTAAVASVPLCYALGKRLFSRQLGLAAAVLLAASSFSVQYAQEARSYSLVLFLILMSTYVFVRAILNGGGGTWAAYVLVTALAGYAHFFAWFIVIAHLASLALLDVRPRPRTLFAAFGSIAVLSAPLFFFLLTTSGDQIGWIPELSLGRVASAIGQFAGARTVVGAVALVPILAAAVLSGLWMFIQTWRSSTRSLETWRLGFVIACLTVPVLGALLVSLVKPIWVDKYLIVALPGLVLTTSVGLDAWKPTLARLGLATILVLSLSQVLVLHLSLDKDDWRAATQYMLERSEPNDGISYYRPFGRFPANYYFDQIIDTKRSKHVPHPTSSIFDISRGPLRPGPRDIPLAAIANASRPFERVWIVLNPVLAEARRGISVALEPDFVLADTAEFRDVVVELYVRRPTLGQR